MTRGLAAWLLGPALLLMAGCGGAPKGEDGKAFTHRSTASGFRSEKARRTRGRRGLRLRSDGDRWDRSEADSVNSPHARACRKDSENGSNPSHLSPDPDDDSLGDVY